MTLRDALAALAYSPERGSAWNLKPPPQPIDVGDRSTSELSEIDLIAKQYERVGRLSICPSLRAAHRPQAYFWDQLNADQFDSTYLGGRDDPSAYLSILARMERVIFDHPGDPDEVESLLLSFFPDRTRSQAIRSLIAEWQWLRDILLRFRSSLRSADAAKSSMERYFF